MTVKAMHQMTCDGCGKPATYHSVGEEITDDFDRAASGWLLVDIQTLVGTDHDERLHVCSRGCLAARFAESSGRTDADTRIYPDLELPSLGQAG